MKKFFYLLPAIALVFAACSDDDDDDGIVENKIEVKAADVTNAPANSAVDQVRLVSSVGASLATASWNNGFSLVLPETIPSASLMTVKDYLEDEWDDEDLENLSVSNFNAKIAMADIHAYKDNARVNYFYLTNSARTAYVEYWHCDSNVTITGNVVDEWTSNGVSYTETTKFNLNLKKGWQSVVYTYSGTEQNGNTEITTTLPSTGLNWYYGDYR